MATKRATRQARRGAAAVEALLTLPVLVTVVLAVVELSMLSAVQEQLLAASREGGRVAALGGNENDVSQAVQRHLGHGAVSAARIQLVLRDHSGHPLPSGNPVQVVVSIPAKQVVPDLLRFIGFSIQKQTLTGSTVMRKE
jgi:hypothetical protein